MAESPATLLVVSHDRRLLETVCEKLWVVGEGSAVAFDGGYKEWRRAVADGWTVAAALEQEAARLRGGRRSTGSALRGPSGPAGPNGTGPRGPVGPPTSGTNAPPAPTKKSSGGKKDKLSKEAYRRLKAAAEGELTRLGLRKSHLELAMGDPAVQGNFVEMRRVTSELADIDVALSAAEDAWLALEERAP